MRGCWIEGKNLPKTVSQFGDTAKQIFVCYDEIEEKYGDGVKELPLGAIGIYSFSQKIRVGLQQLMAGSSNFSLGSITRKDVVALTEDDAKISGISYIMDAYRAEAEEVING